MRSGIDGMATTKSAARLRLASSGQPRALLPRLRSTGRSRCSTLERRCASRALTELMLAPWPLRRLAEHIDVPYNCLRSWTGHGTDTIWDVSEHDYMTATNEMEEQ